MIRFYRSVILAAAALLLTAAAGSAGGDFHTPAPQRSSRAIVSEPAALDTLAAFRTDAYLQAADEPIAFGITNISRRPLRVDPCSVRLHRQKDDGWEIVLGSPDCQDDRRTLTPGQTLEDRFQPPPDGSPGIYRLSVEAKSPGSDALQTIYSNPFRLTLSEAN